MSTITSLNGNLIITNDDGRITEIPNDNSKLFTKLLSLVSPKNTCENNYNKSQKIATWPRGLAVNYYPINPELHTDIIRNGASYAELEVICETAHNTVRCMSRVNYQTYEIPTSRLRPNGMSFRTYTARDTASAPVFTLEELIS